MGTRPVWAPIHLGRLQANYRLLAAAAAGCAPSAGAAPELLAVVKADAYGHGLALCGPALAAAGARWLGVTSVEEGVALRRALGVLPSPLSAARILVMSSLWEDEAEAVLDRGLTPLAWEPYQLAMLHAAARARGLAPGSVPVHLEVDTGMARQGVPAGGSDPAPLQRLLAGFAPGSPLLLEGVLTHFRSPELTEAPDTAMQLGRFGEALAQVAAAGLRPAWVHAGNSATVWEPAVLGQLALLAARTGARLMLRPGLSLYGYPVRYTPERAGGEDSALAPVMAWTTRVTSLRTLQQGEASGYNATFVASRPTRLALVPLGYADGLNRLLSSRGAMLVRGRLAPIAGRISMDQTLLDVTEIPEAVVGEEVVVLGEQGGRRITAYDHADLCGTIPYEIVCNVAARVPRLPTE